EPPMRPRPAMVMRWMVMGSAAGLEVAHDGDDLFVDLGGGVVGQRALIGLMEVRKDGALAIGFVDSGVDGFLDLANFVGGVGAVVEEPQDLLVDDIDFLSPVRYFHRGSASPCSSRLHCCRQSSHKRLDRLGLVAGIFKDPLHDRAAYDSSIGKTTNFSKVLRGRDTETHGDRELRIFAHAGYQLASIDGDFLSRTGNAGSRNGVDKTTALLRDQFQASIGTGGSNHQD